MSATPPPLVLVAETIGPEALVRLAARCSVADARRGTPAFDAAIARAEGLVVRTYLRVDEALLAQAPRLRVVGRAGVGLDNVDLEACRRRGVAVVHTPEANAMAVVEWVFALLLDALRPRRPLVEAVDRETWMRLRDAGAAPRGLGDMRLGILGLGRVGRRVARAARGFEMAVRYHDLVEVPAEERHGAMPVDLETLFRESDALTIHVDGRPGNCGLVGAALLDLLPPDAVLVNAARGFVVDAAALAAHLRRRPEFRAALDVHDPEPFGPDYPLLGLPNATLLPHLAAKTRSAARAMFAVVEDVIAVLEGRAPRWPAAPVSE